MEIADGGDVHHARQEQELATAALIIWGHSPRTINSIFDAFVDRHRTWIAEIKHAANAELQKRGIHGRFGSAEVLQLVSRMRPSGQGKSVGEMGRALAQVHPAAISHATQELAHQTQQSLHIGARPTSSGQGQPWMAKLHNRVQDRLPGHPVDQYTVRSILQGLPSEISNSSTSVIADEIARLIRQGWAQSRDRAYRGSGRPGLFGAGGTQGQWSEADAFAEAVALDALLADLPPWLMTEAVHAYQQAHPAEIRIFDEQEESQAAFEQYRQDLLDIAEAGRAVAADLSVDPRQAPTQEAAHAAIRAAVGDRAARIAAERQAAVGLTGSDADRARYQELTSDPGFRNDLLALVGSALDKEPGGPYASPRPEEVIAAWQKLSSEQRLLPLSQLARSIAPVVAAVRGPAATSGPTAGTAAPDRASGPRADSGQQPDPGQDAVSKGLGKVPKSETDVPRAGRVAGPGPQASGVPARSESVLEDFRRAWVSAGKKTSGDELGALRDALAGAQRLAAPFLSERFGVVARIEEHEGDFSALGRELQDVVVVADHLRRNPGDESGAAELTEELARARGAERRPSLPGGAPAPIRTGGGVRGDGGPAAWLSGSATVLGGASEDLVSSPVGSPDAVDDATVRARWDAALNPGRRRAGHHLPAADPVPETVRRFARSARGADGAPDPVMAAVRIEPVPDQVLDRISDQAARALDGVPSEVLRRRIGEMLTPDDLPERWSALTGEGLPVSVRHEGRSHTVTLRLGLADPHRAESADAPDSMARTSGSTGPGFADKSRGSNRRTLSLNLAAVLGLPVSPEVSATLNEVSTTSMVTATMSTHTSVHVPGRPQAFDFAMRWDLRTEAHEAPGENARWTPLEGAPAPLRVWFPQAPDSATGHRPAALHAVTRDLPLAVVHRVLGADALLDHVTTSFEEQLSEVSEDSLRAIRDFFSSAALAAGMPTMLGGGHTSPVLRTAKGSAVGYFRVTTRLDEGGATAWQPMGDNVTLGNRVQLAAETAEQASVTNSLSGGIGVSLPLPFGSLVSLGLRGKVTGAAVHTLGLTKTVKSLTGLQVTGPSGLVQAGVVHEVTLVGPTGASGEFATTSVPGQVVWHVPSAATALPAPGQADRYLPSEVADLRSLGMSSTVLGVEGTDRLFDHIEREMSQNGLLPDSDAADWIKPGPRREQRLLNQRTLDSLRPQSVQRALLAQLLGGYLVGFGDTERVDGPRAMLSLHVERDTDSPVRHVGSLPAVRTDNQFESGTPSGDRLAGTPIHVGGGGGGSVSPDLEVLGVDVPDAKGQWHGSYARTNTDVRTASVTERLHAPVVSAEGGVEVYAVPAWLYAESEGDRFIQETVKTPVTVHVAVPTHRTSTEPAGAARSEDDMRTGKGAAHSSPSARLSTADAGELLQTAHVEFVAGSRALEEAISTVLGVERRTVPARNLAEEAAAAAHPDAAESADETADAERHPLLTGGPATSPSRAVPPTAGQWLTTQLSGISPASRANLLHSIVRQALDPTRLVANAQTVFGGGLVVEAGMGEGRLAGTRVRVTVEGSLRGLRYEGPVGTVEHRRSLATTKAATTTRRTATHSSPRGTLSGDIAPLEAISSDLQLRGRPTDSTVRTLNDETTTQWMVSAGSSPMHRIRANAEYRVRVQTAQDGVLPASFSADRNATAADRTVTEPDGVELLVTDDELHRLSNWLDDDSMPAPEVAALPEPMLPPAFAPDTGTQASAVVSIRPQGGPGAVRDLVAAFVEEASPGVTSLASGGYLHGVLSQAAELVSAPRLRSLAAAPGTSTGFRFVDRTAFPKMVEVTMTARPAGDLAATGRGRLVPSAGVAAGMSTEDRAVPPSVTRTGGSGLDFDTSLDLDPAEVPLGEPDQTPRLPLPSADTAMDVAGAEHPRKAVAEFQVPFTFTVTVRTTTLSAASQAITQPVPPATEDGRSMSFDATATVRFAADEAPLAVPLQAAAESDTVRQHEDRPDRRRRASRPSTSVPKPVRSLSGDQAGAQFTEPARQGADSLRERFRNALSGVPEATAGSPAQTTGS
jgi:hypothetical protein